MKTSVQLETKEIRAILAKALRLDEKQVVPTRYSFAIEGVPAEEVAKRLKEALS